VPQPADREPRVAISIVAVALEERLERAAQFGGQIFFSNGVEERDGGLICFQLGDAAGAPGEVPLQIRMDRRRQMVLHEVRQQAHEIGAATFM
jgi:hypothetical protein